MVWSAGLGAAQQALATSMEQFEFACIGASMTEDERVISRSLHHFATLIRTIEDERDRMVPPSVCKQRLAGFDQSLSIRLRALTFTKC